MGVVDVLRESRMTEHEVKVYNQVVQEKEMNKHRMELSQDRHPYGGRVSARLELTKNEHIRKSGQALDSLRIDTELANSETSTSFITPDSRMGFAASPDCQWEVNPKLVG